MSLFTKSTRIPVNINDCPAEIHLAIAEHCSFTEVRNLCYVSKRLYTNCLPVLYRDVDLSFHNRGTIDFSYRYGTQLDYEFCEPNEIPIHNLTNRPMRVAFELYNRFEKVNSTHPKQEIFLQTLVAHPEYATYVRSFSWTLLSWNPNVPTSLQLREPTRKPMEQVWKVLKTLRNVKTLDLAYLSDHLKTDLSRQCPRVLFFNATSVRLQGMMEQYHATSILHSVDPAKLTHLTLDNLYDCGRKGPFVRSSGIWRPKLKQEERLEREERERQEGKEALEKIEEPEQEPESPPQQAPAPMSGLLGKLTGHCTALKSLTLCAKLDLHDQQSYYDPNRNRVYIEWALFLGSVQRQMEHFRFEQKPKMLSNTQFPQYGIGHPAALTLYYLDLDFHECFESYLLNPWGWPCLKTLDVAGVTMFNDPGYIGEQVREQVSLTKGGGVKIDFHVKGRLS